MITRPATANIPGGGTGTGPDVTVVDNGNGTVTMANGTVSILITKSGATINQINYTYNNGGGIQTQQLLAGGKDGGEFYWEFGGWGGNPWVYSEVTNNGSYAEVDMYSDSATNGLVDVHFSMLRGSPGFYMTPIWSHRPQDGAFGTGEERDNIYIAPYFNWMSVNDQVQREEGLNATYAVSDYSPQENSLVTSGVDQGTYEDKYKWSADFGVERVWGWSSVSDPSIGLVGQNVGIWHVVASSEFYNGGPLKPELNDAPMVNMINGGHYYFGNDSGFTSGESWTRVSGPYFIYVNNVTNTLTDPVQTSKALYADAKAQAAAEAGAWPYGWMNNANYASAAQRGTVTGQIMINDPYNPNASASNLWVGVIQQPGVTLNNVYDFQLWMKPYQFWTKSDANGNFVISNVISGTNFTLYAFGPGAEGMFMSKNQNGGNPGIIYNLPTNAFTVVVTGGTTNNVGNVTWTPTRVGPTVFEIGYPDRKGDKFRHGDDYWVGDVGPSSTAPSPIWDKFMEFPYDFPNGLNYVVGQNRWNTDWNYVQSVYPDFSGNSDVTSSTVNFNLASAPTNGATASILMGIASDDDTPIYVTVNGTLLSGGNATGTPQASLPTSGWFPNNDISDSNIREENHGGYSDERLTFSASLLKVGNNTINFSFRQAGGSGFTHHFMYDYIRLELTGYVPPAPAAITANAGNDSALLSWPAVAGATSYNILRTTTSSSGYISITNGVVGPVCGSGPANVNFVDYNAVNGTTYYYVVQSASPVGMSANSTESGGVTPSAGLSTAAPATPTGLTVTSTNNAVTFAWNAVPGANFYTVYRGTVVNRLGYVPMYSILSDTTTSPTYTDASGTLGCTYSYYVTASSAGGTSGSSTAVTGKPVPPPPAAPTANVHLSDSITSTNQTIQVSWSPVSGAVGYILYRANSVTGPFSFPGNYVQSVTTTNYRDGNLATNTLYAYEVIAMNAGGISGASAVVSTAPPPPASLGATAGNREILLNWTASSSATSYTIERGYSSGGETILATGITGTSFTDSNLVNGLTYYYVVTAFGPGGTSANSPEASATPTTVVISGLVWTGSSNAVWDTTTTNWLNGITSTAYADGEDVLFNNSGANANVVINSNLFPDSVTISNSTINYTYNGGGGIYGNAGLLKVGAGVLTINNTNLYSGGTIISNSTIIIGNTTPNIEPLGTGPVVLLGGVLQLNGYNQNNSIYWGALSNNLVVPTGQTGTLLCPARVANNGLVGTLTGGGIVNLVVDYVRGSLYGDWSAFSGQIYVGPRSGTADFRINNAYGYANAAIYLSNGITMYNDNGNGQMTDIGELAGSSGATLGPGNGNSTNPTWRIGARNTTNNYAGRIVDAGTTTLNKIGTGTFILSGVSNTFSGGTTISGGTLLANNTNGSATGYGTVTVMNGGTLGGTGIISGTVTVNAGGALAPGNPIGTLTFSNSLILNTMSTNYFSITTGPLSNTVAKVLGGLTCGGTLVVNNTGNAPLAEGNSFKLFNAASYSGSFAGFNLPVLPVGLGWNTGALNTNGVISVVVNTQPVIGVISLLPGGLALTGSGGVANGNFYLLSSSNLAAPLTSWMNLSTNQFDTNGDFNFTNPISPGSAQNYYILKIQ